MFYHDTDSQEVLMHVDKVEKENNQYRFLGWMAHKTSEIIGLNIEGKNIGHTSLSRPDVVDAYPMLKNDKVGMEFVLSKEQLRIPLNIVTKEGQFCTVGKMEKWAVVMSGFNPVKKNIVVVDDFYSDPDFVRNFAINNLDYNPSGYHKGRRSQRFLLNGTKEKLEEIMGRKVINWNHPEYANGVFQYCSSEDPIVYHSDKQTYAAAIYLTPNAPLRSGTSTYRSTITGATMFDPGEARGEVFFKTFSQGGSELNFYDNSTLEVVDSIANVYNRLVIWDGRAIHAGNGYFGTDINDSRFFQLFFFDLA